MKNKIRFIITLAALTLSLSSCVWDANVEHSKDYRDSDKWGKVMKETLDLKDFSSIYANQTIDIIYEQGDEYSVVLEGNEKAIPCYKFIIESDTIHGSGDKKLVVTGNSETGYNYISTIPSVRLHITAPTLTSVELWGDGDFDIKEAATFDDIAFSIGGRGDIDVKTLKAKNVNVEIFGTGDLKARDLKAENLNVTIKGTGDVELRRAKIDNEVTLNIYGAGDIDGTIKAKKLIAASKGVGDIDIEVECEEVEAMAAGSGDVEIAGETNILSKKRSGLASVTTKHLKVNEIKK